MRTKIEVLTDIRRQPEVDAHRYEYADVVEARDPEYAAYIRERVRWASYPKGSRPPIVYNDGVEARIAQPVLQFCYAAQFDRGFVEQITVDPFVFIDRGQQILDLAPIQTAIFSPKPLPQGLEPPLGRTIVPSPIKELMACPLLEQLYSIAFIASDDQRWLPHADDIESVLTSPYLSRLILLTLPEWKPKEFDVSQCRSFWQRAFSRHEFRKMLTLGLPGYPGEERHEIEDGQFRIAEVRAMPQEGRDLERVHGYLPCLHLAAKWGTSDLNILHDNELILAAQRGELPTFPVGAPVTEEMYAAPPRKRYQSWSD